MTRKTVAGLFAVLYCASPIWASVVLETGGGNPGIEYSIFPNQTFTSRGITYKLVDFPGTGSNQGARVTELRNFPTTFVQMYGIAGVEVQVPPSVDGLSVSFVDSCTFCGSTQVIVNGVSSSHSEYDKVSFLNGANVGGVDIAVTGPSQQTLTLTGPIQSFAIGGGSLTIFDLSFHVVPEPATLVSTLLAALLVSFVARPRRSPN